ncbi:MAG TPA: FlgO family outer membrane protein, partial [Spirochaetia bacterium]|nr:FlgO family outer membrane protein [Spirochaetia bacterium]
MRLDNEGFDDEIGILNRYVEILGRELKLQEAEKKRIVEDQEIAPPVKMRSLQDNLGNLFREMTLNLQIEKRGVLAVSGFTTVRKETEKLPALLSLLNETAVMELSKLDTFRLVERERLVAVLEEQELALSDLMDTTTAIRIGHILSANYILTGSVIETSDSVIIFGRIINVETAEIQSVSQVIIQKDANVKALL